MGKLQTIRNLPAATSWLFLKAVFISAVVRATLLFLPFKKVLSWLGEPNKETAQDTTAAYTAYAHKVKTALWLCNKYTPWKTECYVQALTARILLRRKGVPSTIYIGFRKNSDNQYEGHAWLRTGGIIVTGNKKLSAFHVHSFFS